MKATDTGSSEFSSSFVQTVYNEPIEIKTGELSQEDRVSRIAYSCQIESKVSRITTTLFSILAFPYHALQTLVGKIALLPASTPLITGMNSIALTSLRQSAPKEPEYIVKRITIEVDGYQVDAIVIGKKETFGNGRWILNSIGNGEYYEQIFTGQASNSLALAEQIGGNVICFNYPGVGASSGLPSKGAMVKAYRAVLSFLEDKEKGIGAKEIIALGHSIGGGVQAEALKEHSLKEEIKYVCVKGRTFSTYATAADELISKIVRQKLDKRFSQFIGSKTRQEFRFSRLAGKVAGKIAAFGVRFFRWNFNTLDSPPHLKAKEIVLQYAKFLDNLETNDLEDDGILTKEATLAYDQLNRAEEEKKDRPDEKIQGIFETHNELLRLGTITILGDNIKALLK